MFRRIGIGCVGCLGLIVIAVVVLAIVGAVAGGKSGNNASSGDNGARPTTGTIGTKIHIPDNLDVTLVSARVKSGSEFEKPKPGNVWLITTWKFHNFRSGSTDVAPTGFSVQSAGVIRQPEYFSSLDNNLLDVSGTSLAPGGSTTGDILFQVKKKGIASITYAPDDFDQSKKGIWKVRD